MSFSSSLYGIFQIIFFFSLSVSLSVCHSVCLSVCLVRLLSHFLTVLRTVSSRRTPPLFSTSQCLSERGTQYWQISYKFNPFVQIFILLQLEVLFGTGKHFWQKRKKMDPMASQMFLWGSFDLTPRRMFWHPKQSRKRLSTSLVSFFFAVRAVDCFENKTRIIDNLTGAFHKCRSNSALMPFWYLKKFRKKRRVMSIFLVPVYVWSGVVK